MKKTLSIVLVIVLFLALSACDNTEDTTQTQEMTSAPIDTANENVIEFGSPVVIWEDDNIKIELLSFYQEFVNWGVADKEPATEKGITVRYYNKTDYGVIIQLQEAYLGVDAVQILHSAGSETPASGKATTREYLIQKVVGSNTTALESMEDLYQLDGRFWVGIKHDKNSSIADEHYNIEFDFASIVNSNG